MVGNVEGEGEDGCVVGIARLTIPLVAVQPPRNTNIDLRNWRREKTRCNDLGEDEVSITKISFKPYP